ncbi:MAG: tail fiber domain-containing protein [Xanthomonadales bacterium]|nr:tail fiber domain-containing protein [Xanthomonadales bacterium]
MPGGSENQAAGDYSFASGRRALALHAGTFVWADSQNANFVSTGVDQFLVQAQGGVAINTNAPTAGSALTVAGNVSIPASSLLFGSATRQMLNLFGTGFGSGVQLNTHYFRSGTGFAWFQGGTHNDNENNAGTGGNVLMTLTPNGISPSVTYSGRVRAQTFDTVSDRAAKTGFAPIDAGEVLARVAQLPVSAWSYRDAPEVRHIGPVAQDFRAAFGLGDDERTISTVDTAGVALAAIQGLNAKLEAENAALREDNAAIRSELDALRELVESRLNAEH